MLVCIYRLVLAFSYLQAPMLVQIALFIPHVQSTTRGGFTRGDFGSCFSQLHVSSAVERVLRVFVLNSEGDESELRARVVSVVQQFSACYPQVNSAIADGEVV